jgi:hypothetical protein
MYPDGENTKQVVKFRPLSNSSARIFHEDSYKNGGIPYGFCCLAPKR